MRSRILVYRELQFVLSHCPLHYVSPYSAAEQYNYGRLVPVALALHLSPLTSIILYSTIIPHVFNAFGPQLPTRPYQFYIRRLQMLLAIKPPHSRTTHTASTDACLFLGRSPSPLPYICTYSFTLLFLVHGFTDKLAKPICITYGARRYAVLKDFHIHK